MTTEEILYNQIYWKLREFSEEMIEKRWGNASKYGEMCIDDCARAHRDHLLNEAGDIERAFKFWSLTKDFWFHKWFSGKQLPQIQNYLK